MNGLQRREKWSSEDTLWGVGHKESYSLAEHFKEILGCLRGIAEHWALQLSVLFGDQRKQICLPLRAGQMLAQPMNLDSLSLPSPLAQNNRDPTPEIGNQILRQKNQMYLLTALELDNYWKV